MTAFVPPPVAPKYYLHGQIVVAALTGGWIAGCWLLARNHRLFGEARRARHVMIFGVVFTAASCAALRGCLIMMTGHPGPFHVILSVLVLILTWYVVAAMALHDYTIHCQDDQITAHEGLGAKTHSIWRVQRVVWASWVLTIIIYAAMNALFNVLLQAPV